MDDPSIAAALSFLYSQQCLPSPNTGKFVNGEHLCIGYLLALSSCSSLRFWTVIPPMARRGADLYCSRGGASEEDPRKRPRNNFGHFWGI